MWITSDRSTSGQHFSCSMNHRKLAWLLACSWLFLQLEQPAAIALKLDPAFAVHAFYYVWYGEPSVDGVYKHWDHEQLPHWDAAQAAKYPSGKLFTPPDSVHSPFYPWRGPYSSRNATIIQQHVEELLDSGVNVMVVSWWGPAWREGTTDTQGVNTDQVLQEVVAVVEQHPDMQVALHMEPYPGRTAVSFREDLEHLVHTLGNSSALLRVEGRPLYYLYDSYRISPQDWAALFDPQGASTIRGTPLDGVFLGLWLDHNDGDGNLAPAFLDGFYTYFASEAVSYASQFQNWPALASWANAHDKLFIASVGPGYNDTRIRPWNAGATRARNNGQRYQNWWQAAIGAGAHGVSITSYNEFGEGTQIEPVQPWTEAATGKAYQDYGEGGPHLYMHLTKRFAAEFKSKLGGLRHEQGQEQQQPASPGSEEL